MLDIDVGKIYGVATREINQARRNNPTKFIHPKTGEPFAWQLTNDETQEVESKILITYPTVLTFAQIIPGFILVMASICLLLF